jgi:flavorubredoxin
MMDGRKPSQSKAIGKQGKPYDAWYKTVPCQIGMFTDTRHKNPAQNVHALAS